MFRRIILYFSVIVIIGAQSIPGPKLKPCKKDDSVCQTKNSNKVYKMSVTGIPELNIDRIDPMHQDVFGDLGVIKYELTNSTLEGFKDCNVIETKVDSGKSKIQLNLHCPYLKSNGLYKISGNLIIMPIEGDGEYKLKFKDYYINIDTDIKTVQGKDGKKYLSIKSFKVDCDLEGGMNAHLTNLFNGQKLLGDNALKFINSNWRPVAKLLQGPAFDAHIKQLIKNFNKSLKHIPLDQLHEE